MFPRCRRLAGRLSCRGAWVFLAMLGVVTAARGQSIGVDPYDPWNAMYRPFIFPGAMSNPALPNQGRLPYLGTGRGASPYESRMGVFGDGFSFDQGQLPGGRRLPFAQSFQAYRAQRTPPEGATQAEMDRMYIPNRNDTFQRDLQTRDARFFEALRERDPRRRAEMLRELDKGSRSTTRPGAGQAAAPAAAPAAADAPADGLKPPAEAAASPVLPSTISLREDRMRRLRDELRGSYMRSRSQVPSGLNRRGERDGSGAGGAAEAGDPPR